MPVKKGFPEGDKRLVRGVNHYNSVFQQEADREGKYTWPWQRQAARTVTYYPALLLAIAPILDVGCGAGQLAAMARAYGVAYAMGFDFSKRAVDLARKQCPSASFEIADATTAPALMQSTDYKTAVFLEVLEHVYEDLDIIAQVPVGKTVVASVPNFHTEGHCRWFPGEKEVIERYSRVLKMDRVITEQSGGSNQWFIFRGGRR